MDKAAGAMAGRAWRAGAWWAISVNGAAGGANWIAAAGVADESADSISQQDAGASMEVPAGACGP